MALAWYEREREWLHIQKSQTPPTPKETNKNQSLKPKNMVETNSCYSISYDGEKNSIINIPFPSHSFITFLYIYIYFLFPAPNLLSMYLFYTILQFKIKYNKNPFFLFLSLWPIPLFLSLTQTPTTTKKKHGNSTQQSFLFFCSPSKK